MLGLGYLLLIVGVKAATAQSKWCHCIPKSDSSVDTNYPRCFFIDCSFSKSINDSNKSDSTSWHQTYIWIFNNETSCDSGNHNNNSVKVIPLSDIDIDSDVPIYIRNQIIAQSPCTSDNGKPIRSPPASLLKMPSLRVYTSHRNTTQPPDNSSDGKGGFNWGSVMIYYISGLIAFILFCSCLYCVYNRYHNRQQQQKQHSSNGGMTLSQSLLSYKSSSTNSSNVSNKQKYDNCYLDFDSYSQLNKQKQQLRQFLSFKKDLNRKHERNHSKSKSSDHRSDHSDISSTLTDDYSTNSKLSELSSDASGLSSQNGGAHNLGVPRIQGSTTQSLARIQMSDRIVNLAGADDDDVVVAVARLHSITEETRNAEWTPSPYLDAIKARKTERGIVVTPTTPLDTPLDTEEVSRSTQSRSIQSSWRQFFSGSEVLIPEDRSSSTPSSRATHSTVQSVSVTPAPPFILESRYNSQSATPRRVSDMIALQLGGNGLRQSSVRDRDRIREYAEQEPPYSAYTALPTAHHKRAPV